MGRTPIGMGAFPKPSSTVLVNSVSCRVLRIAACRVHRPAKLGFERRPSGRLSSPLRRAVFSTQLVGVAVQTNPSMHLNSKARNGVVVLLVRQVALSRS